MGAECFTLLQGAVPALDLGQLRPQLTQVERWYRSLQEREAFRTHIMIPFGELRGRFYD